MKRLLSVFLLSLIASHLLAQADRPRGNNKITGTVVDATTKQPVEFTTIAVKDESGAVIDGAVADDKGKFAVTKLAPESIPSPFPL